MNGSLRYRARLLATPGVALLMPVASADLAKFIRRLICTECGSQSVRAYRELQDAG